jgi:hypothetical protein
MHIRNGGLQEMKGRRLRVRLASPNGAQRDGNDETRAGD